MSRRKSPVLDIYLKYPMLIDAFGIIIILIIWNFFKIIPFYFTDKATILNIVSSLIGTCISLAGFILAALTIIVTFRSNLKAKGVDDASNAMELIISSGYYNDIVKVYTGAIYEFLLVGFGLYFFWLSIDNISNLVIMTKAVMCGVIMTATPVFRSLWVLFSIIGLEKHSN